MTITLIISLQSHVLLETFQSPSTHENDIWDVPHTETLLHIVYTHSWKGHSSLARPPPVWPPSRTQSSVGSAETTPKPQRPHPVTSNSQNTCCQHSSARHHRTPPEVYCPCLDGSELLYSHKWNYLCVFKGVADQWILLKNNLKCLIWCSTKTWF